MVCDRMIASSPLIIAHSSSFRSCVNEAQSIACRKSVFGRRLEQLRRGDLLIADTNVKCHDTSSMIVGARCSFVGYLHSSSLPLSQE